MIRVLLNLGSNLGKREDILTEAVQSLQPQAVSHVYYTPPWGDPGQPDYANVAVLVEKPGWDVRRWFDYTRELERNAGRVRDPERRYGPRTLDIDLIVAWEDGQAVVSSNPEITLPHPRAHLRAFVLQPWVELDPKAELPGHGPIVDLLETETLAHDVTKMTMGPTLNVQVVPMEHPAQRNQRRQSEQDTDGTGRR